MKPLVSIAIVLVEICRGSALEITLPGDAPPPVSPAQSADQVEFPKGFQFELVASEPLINEPAGVCWDERGRLFVCELHGYNLEGQYDIDALNKTGELDHVVRRITRTKRPSKPLVLEQRHSQDAH